MAPFWAKPLADKLHGTQLWVQPLVWLWGQDPWCLALGAALDTAMEPVAHLQLRSHQGLAQDHQQEMGRALTGPRQLWAQGSGHIDLYEWNPAHTEERTHTDKLSFICMDALFQQGSMFLHCPQAMRFFLFGYYYSMCSGCEITFFLHLQKRIPKSHWSVVRLIQDCVARFQSIKKKWNTENRATIHIYVMNIQLLIDSQKFRCNEKWDISNKMLAAYEELHPQQTPPSLLEVNSCLFAQMDCPSLQLS